MKIFSLVVILLKSSRTLFKNIKEVKTALKGVKFSNNKLARVKRTQYKNLSTTDRKKKFNTKKFSRKRKSKNALFKRSNARYTN